MHDEDELTASLTDLAGLLTEHRSLEQTLNRIAELAVHAVPGAEGASLTLLESDRPQTVIWTAPFVQEVDDIQYGVNEGPCMSAVAQRQTFTSGNLGGAQQWPRFGPRAGRIGVHSALSLPLLAGERTLGALNLYARAHEAFDDHAVRLGEAFRGPAAVSVANAQMLAQAERLVAQLTAALTSRADIDQALGIIRSRTGGTSDDAFSRLRSESQSTQVKLVDIARDIVDEAVARARARHHSAPQEPPPQDHDG